MMTIKERIEYNIDKIQDGIDFKILLFNEGKYDREELRTIIRNVGLKLSIVNNMQIPIEVKNIYLGIFNQGKLKNLFSSNQLSLQLPTTINPTKEFSVYFYGWDIRDKFERFKDEKGMFIFSTTNNKITFHSSKFDGDDIERKITTLEDGEMANWGSRKYCLIDVESEI